MVKGGEVPDPELHGCIIIRIVCGVKLRECRERNVKCGIGIKRIFASAAKQSRSTDMAVKRDCRVASLLAMTTRGIICETVKLRFREIEKEK